MRNRSAMLVLIGVGTCINAFGTETDVIEVKLGTTIARTSEQVKADKYAYGPKQEYDSGGSSHAGQAGHAAAHETDRDPEERYRPVGNRFGSRMVGGIPEIQPDAAQVGCSLAAPLSRMENDTAQREPMELESL